MHEVQECARIPEDANTAALVRRYYELAKRGLWCEAQSTQLLRGVVTDFRGRPVSGASIVVEYRGLPDSGGVRRERVVQAESDADGFFELRAPSMGVNSVVVTADGMLRHAYAVSAWRGIYIARLTRELSDTLIAEVNGADQQAALWSLLELIVSRDDEEEARLFPQLGQLRESLRALVDGGLFDATDDGTVSPAQRARRLLALWHSDADRPLINAWVEASTVRSEPFCGKTDVLSSTAWRRCS